MPLLLYRYMELFIKNGDYWQQGERRLKNKKEILQLLKQSGSLPKWQSSTVKAISKELIQSAMGIGWRPGSQGGSNPSEPHSGP